MASPDYTPQPEGLESPAVVGVMFTPTDASPLPFVTRGFVLDAESALHVVWADGVEQGDPGYEETIPTGFYAAGITHPARFRKIFATGTDATSILILR